jgi:hypothetical protein
MPLDQLNPHWMKITGICLHALVAALMAFSGFGKVFGFAPREVVEAMTKQGLKDRIRLIGLGEMAGAILLILPWDLTPRHPGGQRLLGRCHLSAHGLRGGLHARSRRAARGVARSVPARQHPLDGLTNPADGV